MPSPAELVGRLVRFVGEILGASSLRFEIGPTLAVLGILLVLLQLVARPVSRWVSSDAGGLTAVGRAMALAAESGTDVVVSLGNGGLVRATDALARLQTLAALPALSHVARAAARRSPVTLRPMSSHNPYYVNKAVNKHRPSNGPPQGITTEATAQRPPG